jgi:hypothetical protein
MFRMFRAQLLFPSSPPPSVFAARQLEPPRCRPFQYLGPNPYITIHTTLSSTFSPHWKPAILRSNFSLPKPLRFFPLAPPFSLFNSTSHFRFAHLSIFHLYQPYSDHRRRHTADDNSDNSNHDHYRLAAPIPTPAARG